MAAKKQAKVRKVMREFKEGTLHSGKKGPVVKSRKQAVAIALSEAGIAKKKGKKRGSAITKAERATPAVKVHKAASEAIGRVVKNAQRDTWISQADRDKRAKQAKLEAESLKRSRERLKELQKRGKK